MALGIQMSEAEYVLFMSETNKISYIIAVSNPVKEISCWLIINTLLEQISLYTTSKSPFNCGGERLAFLIFNYITIERNLNFWEKKI